MSPLSDADKQRNYRARLRAREEMVEDDAVRSFVRSAIAVGLAGINKTRAGDVARQNFPDDPGVPLILRAATQPTSTQNSSALSVITVAILDALVPASAGIDLLRRGVELNFAGAASITVPAIAVPNATFVGEGQPIPVRAPPTTPGPVLSPHKLATICALTGEMMRSSNAESMVRQVLVESTGPAIDAILFSASAATASQPAGLLSGITPITPTAAGGTKGEILVDDLQKIATALAPVAGNGDVILIGSPDVAVSLRLRLPSAMTWPVLTSASLAPKTLIAIAPAAIVSAIDGVPVIDISTQATVHYDTQPGEIADIGGVMARPVGNVFPNDEAALRLRWLISWALRDARGIALMTGVNW